MISRRPVEECRKFQVNQWSLSNWLLSTDDRGLVREKKRYYYRGYIYEDTIAAIDDYTGSVITKLSAAGVLNHFPGGGFKLSNWRGRTKNSGE